MGKHDAFALAGRAGSENNRRKIIGGYLDIFILSITIGDKLFALGYIFLKIGNVKIMLHRNADLFYLLDLRGIMLGIHDGLALALVELNCEILRGQLGIERHADYLPEKICEESDNPLIRVLTEDRYLAVANTVGKHIGAQAVDIMPNVVEGAGLDSSLMVIHKERLILSFCDAVNDKLLDSLDIRYVIEHILVLFFHFFTFLSDFYFLLLCLTQ